MNLIMKDEILFYLLIKSNINETLYLINAIKWTWEKNSIKAKLDKDAAEHL